MGFALFERVQSEEIGVTLAEVQKSITDLQKFSQIIKLKSFLPFTTMESALENINSISEGEITKSLGDFLEMNLPKKKKGDGFQLGVTDPKLGNSISELLSVKCEHNELVLELFRGIRVHFGRFIKNLKHSDIITAQLGLSHSYSRAKVKFNVHKVDNMIIQSIAILDQLDKDLNTFCMRVREWYSWHFPELFQVVKDNITYARLAAFIKNKSTLTDEAVPALTEITDDKEKAEQIVAAAKMSMGTDISDVDMANIETFANRVVSLGTYRKNLHNYLCKKMDLCAPNLTALIGEQVGARLISHAGSLTSLAKYPASTVQILGAEKALFRALKTKGKTPKYGLIFNSTFIGRAAQKNKGRISRYVANKISLASRIDSFSDTPSSTFGSLFKSQVEERLEFYKTGAAPRKNIDVMKEAIAKSEEAEKAAEAEKPKKSKKRKAETQEVAPAEDEASAKKKAKKAKKEAEAAAAAPAAEEPAKKKKSKKSKKE